MPKASPLVSIIMPAYNAGRFIGAAIESILAQTYSYWELIIVDDGSTDNTREIIEKYNDNRIHLLKMPHSGINSAVRNHGIKATQGEYIAFLDADDVYLSDTIETLLFQFLNNPELIAAYGFERFIDEKNEFCDFNWYNISHFNSSGQFILNPEYDHSWDKYLNYFGYCQLQSLMIPKTTLDSIGIFDESLYLHSDMHFFAKLYKEDASKVKFIPKVVFYHRVNNQSVTTDKARLLTTLKHIPYTVDTFHQLLQAANQPGYSKSFFAAKFYRRYLSIRLNRKDFHSARMIIQEAYKDANLNKADLLSFLLVDFLRFAAPGLFFKYIKPNLKPLKRKLINFRNRYFRYKRTKPILSSN